MVYGHERVTGGGGHQTEQGHVTICGDQLLCYLVTIAVVM